MLICHELPIPGHHLQWLFLQDGIVSVYVAYKLRLANHKDDIDMVTVALGFLTELIYLTVFPYIQKYDTLSSVIYGHIDKRNERLLDFQQLAYINV